MKTGEDTGYWNTFYHNKGVTQIPSPFAQFCATKFKENSSILELGCGNGRDALFFLREGHTVMACDLAEEAIKELQGIENSTFFVADFTQLPEKINENLFDIIYSRFTLHSIPKHAASKTLEWVYRNLKENGTLFIEVRSVNDPLCGQGTKVEHEKDAYITSHYRRFVRNEELIEELKQIGFDIIENVESNGLAVYKDEDPVVIRVIARR